MKTHSFLILAALGSIMPLSAAVTTNFDTFTAGNITAPFTEANANAAADSLFVDLGAGDIALRQAVTGTSTNSASNTFIYVQDSNLVGAGKAFRISATFTIEAFTSTGVANTSVNAATNSSFGNGYRLAFTTASTTPGAVGALSLAETGGALANIVTTGSAISFNVGTVLTLTLEGTYSTATAISLFGSLKDQGGNVLATITATDSSASATDFFGLRTAVNGNGTQIQAAYTNLTVEAIPEPSSAALLLAAGGLLGIRRRKA